MTERPEGLPVIKVVTARGVGDCALCCLAMLLGKPYEDVLAVAVSSTKDYKVHQRGMYVSQIMRTAKRMGVILHRRKRWNGEQTGILSLGNRNTGEGHVVIVTAGLLIDVDGTIWQPETFFANTAYEAECILTLE